MPISKHYKDSNFFFLIRGEFVRSFQGGVKQFCLVFWCTSADFRARGHPPPFPISPVKWYYTNKPITSDKAVHTKISDFLTNVGKTETEWKPVGRWKTAVQIRGGGRQKRGVRLGSASRLHWRGPDRGRRMAWKHLQDECIFPLPVRYSWQKKNPKL